MLPWLSQALRSLRLRPATTADGPAIQRLIDQARHAHLHLDWRPVTAWIGCGPALVAESHAGLVGCLIAPADSPPAAWLRAAAVAAGVPPRPVIGPLVDACLVALAAQRVTSLSAMTTEPWLEPILDELGFVIVEHVESWVKDDLLAHRLGPEQVQVRPARPEDLAELALIEAQAFVPRWRHSAETLGHAWGQATVFTVAERDKALAGFQFSQADGERAHLVRLTVRPASQRCGVGSCLLADALARYQAAGLSRVSLNTQTDNHASHRLYAAFGFYPIPGSLAVWERPV